MIPEQARLLQNREPLRGGPQIGLVGDTFLIQGEDVAGHGPGIHERNSEIIVITRPQAGDLSDYIALRHDEGATVTAAPDDTLSTVLARMRLYDISQLPVLENGRLKAVVAFYF